MSDIGVVGLAVMGENIVMNMESKGYKVSVFNRTTEKVDRFISGRASDKNVKGCSTVKEFVDSLAPPRKILMMVKAGEAVDKTISSILPHLEKGDILIDGGNSNYVDTERRYEDLKRQGIRYIGTGISGGEEGALKGPSIMPGGDQSAWEEIKDILKSISAKYEGVSCCDFMGSGGAGHFVKMVHNGIEYGDMQLIAETYHMMKSMGYDNESMAESFSAWNKGKLDSYLIDITEKILRKKENGEYVLDKILDSAGQKGTGKWTAFNALEQGVPATIITESVFARFISSYVDERKKASRTIARVIEDPGFDLGEEDMSKALYLAKVLSYAQGFQLLKKASEVFGWDIDLSSVARVWRAGCIIRSAFLSDLADSFENEDVDNIIVSEMFKSVVEEGQKPLRKLVAYCSLSGVPCPSFSSALSYFDAYTTERLPANLVQAQRDFFGAHTYERIDEDRGKHFHTDWTGEGGDTTSSTYDA